MDGETQNEESGDVDGGMNKEGKEVDGGIEKGEGGAARSRGQRLSQ